MALRNESEVSIVRLLGDLIGDLRTLVHQEIALARAETAETLESALIPALLFGAAISMLAAGGLWILIAVTRGFADLFALPIWAAYAVVGLLLAIAGGLLIAVAQYQVRGIRVLPKTRRSLQQGLSHVHRQSQR
jgi:hypothetical protein